MGPFETDALDRLKGLLDQRETEYLSPLATMSSGGCRREPEERPGG